MYLIFFGFDGMVTSYVCVFREPRGFGFVKFRNPDDAFEAKQHMNHKIIGGREITIVFAEENRKNPQEMRKTARVRYSLLSVCYSIHFISWFILKKFNIYFLLNPIINFF